MFFSHPLIEGLLLKRYKRFFVELEHAETKEILIAHCPNTGSMQGALELPQRAFLSRAENPNRKLKYTLEILEHNGTLVGANTHNTNYLAEEAIRTGVIEEFLGFKSLVRERKYGINSRIDILLEDKNGTPTYIEVKNVSMTDMDGCSLFPDSVTERGTKHLHELMEIAAQGKRAVMLFIAQRGDVDTFAPAATVDPIYAKTLREAQQKGVEILAYNCDVSPSQILVTKKLNTL